MYLCNLFIERLTFMAVQELKLEDVASHFLHAKLRENKK